MNKLTICDVKQRKEIKNQRPHCTEKEFLKKSYYRNIPLNYVKIWFLVFNVSALFHVAYKKFSTNIAYEF